MPKNNGNLRVNNRKVEAQENFKYSNTKKSVVRQLLGLEPESSCLLKNLHFIIFMRNFILELCTGSVCETLYWICLVARKYSALINFRKPSYLCHEKLRNFQYSRFLSHKNECIVWFRGIL